MHSESRRRSQVSVRTVWTIGLNIFVILIVLLFIYHTRHAFILILLSLLLTGAVNPVIAWAEAEGLKRPFAVLLFFGVFLGILALLAFSFVPLLQDQIRNLIASAPELLERLRQSSLFQWADHEIGLMDRVIQNLQSYGSNLAQVFLGVLTGIFRGLLDLVMVLVLTIFMLIFGGDLIRSGLGFVEPASRFHYLEIIRRIQKTVGGYVAGTLLIATIGGVVITLSLVIMNVPYFLPLGVLMVVLGLIPYIGALIAAVLIVSTALASTGAVTAIVMAAIFLVYQQIENHLLQPLVQRRTIRMNPLMIVLIILLGTSLAGILGTVLALPIAGSIQVVLQEIARQNKMDHPERQQQRMNFEELKDGEN